MRFTNTLYFWRKAEESAKGTEHHQRKESDGEIKVKHKFNGQM